jgi:hypothetical protein
MHEKTLQERRRRNPLRIRGENLRKNNVLIRAGSSGGSNRSRRIGWRRKIWTIEEFTFRRSSGGAYSRRRTIAIGSHSEIPSAVGSGEAAQRLSTGVGAQEAQGGA